jgi:uncharacterized protein (TIGR03435 family)
VNTLKLILVLIPFGAAFAQPVFDVASVKPSPPGGDTIDINLGRANHGVVTLTNTTLSECIRYAYGLVSEDQISGPDWIRDRHLRVDIVAKAPPDTPSDQLLLMTASLLAERFRLTLHREPKRIAHLELGVARSGPQLRLSRGDTPAVRLAYGRGRLDYNHLPMHTLAVLLSRQLRQPVIDGTGLSGFYDVNLEWTPDDGTASPPADADTTPHPDIFSAIQQQLGLKLEVSKGPLDVLIIDHAEKIPIAN